MPPHIQRLLLILLAKVTVNPIPMLGRLFIVDQEALQGATTHHPMSRILLLTLIVKRTGAPIKHHFGRGRWKFNGELIVALIIIGTCSVQPLHRRAPIRRGEQNIVDGERSHLGGQLCGTIFGCIYHFATL